MYSAIKQGGQPLYRLARQGVEVERAAREVHIRALRLDEVRQGEADFSVECSKGTYVRTLAEDIAQAIGSLAHLSRLRRLSVAPFGDAPMHTLEAVLADPAGVPLLPPDAALLHLGEIRLGAAEEGRLRRGQVARADTAAVEGALLRAYGPDGFAGIAQAMPGGLAKPVRIFNHLGPSLT